MTLSSLAAAAPFTVVAGGATLGYALLGTSGIPVAYLAVGLVLAIFSAGYTAMARKITNAGALYTYITRGIGRVPGVAAAFVAVPAYFAMHVGLVGGFGAVTSGFVAEFFGWQVAWWWFAGGGLVAVAVLGVHRIDFSGKLLGVLLVAEIVAAVVYAIVQVAHPAGGHLSTAALSPGHLLDGDTGAAMVVAVTGFVGFEICPVFSEESKDPRRTVPHATYLAVVISALLYAGCSWAMSVATGPDQIVAAAQAESSNLIFALVQPHVAAPLIFLGMMLFTTSLFAAMLSFHNTDARYLFALGREGALWRRFGRTAARSLAPRTASITLTVLSAAVVVVYAVAGWDPMINLFFWLTVAGGLGVLILLTATSVAVLCYFATPQRRRAGHVEHPGASAVPRRRSGAASRRDVSWWSWPCAPAIATVLLAVILILTVQQFHLLLGVTATSPWRWIFPIGFAAAATMGTIWAIFLRAARPQVYQGIGLGARSILADPPATGTARAGAR